jgi:hypothetical protein
MSDKCARWSRHPRLHLSNHTKIATQFKGLVKGLGARSLQLIFNDLAALHHKFNSLQLRDIF